MTMKRVRWYRPGQWWGVLPARGSDELGRHTVVLPLHLFGTVVVATKPCDCADMTEFRCVTAGCEWLAYAPESKCLECDPYIEDDEVAVGA